jgi:hypothetical protein
MTTSSSDHTTSTFPPESLARPSVVTGDQARAIFGQVMGLVTATVGFLALGAYVGRDLSGGLGIAFFLAAFACLIGLNIASGRSRQQLSITLPVRIRPAARARTRAGHQRVRQDRPVRGVPPAMRCDA